jgi:NADPH:quinone reductase-like Zn-dependent oxidoreductase
VLEVNRCFSNKASKQAYRSAGDTPSTWWLAYADATMLLPDGLDYEQAAPLFCAGYTVWSGLRWAEPQPGERLGVVGIGGLAHLAVEYAKAAGFTTIAVSRSPDKDKFVRELGADEIVRDGKAWPRSGCGRDSRNEQFRRCDVREHRGPAA